jgi:hypothetical protein
MRVARADIPILRSSPRRLPRPPGPSRTRWFCSRFSEDTAETDLGPKLTEYARLPSIRRYVTIEQRRMDVTSRERTRSGWTSTELPSGNLNLPELGISLLLQAINRRVGL